MMPEQCVAHTKAGQPCTQRRDLSPAGYCRWHDPARAEEMRALRRKGQQASIRKAAENRRVRLAQLAETAGPRPPVGDSLETVAQFLRWLLEAGARGEVDPGTLAGLTSTARAVMGAYERRDLERRLKAALKELDALKRQASR